LVLLCSLLSKSVQVVQVVIVAVVVLVAVAVVVAVLVASLAVVVVVVAWDHVLLHVDPVMQHQVLPQHHNKVVVLVSGLDLEPVAYLAICLVVATVVQAMDMAVVMVMDPDSAVLPSVHVHMALASVVLVVVAVLVVPTHRLHLLPHDVVDHRHSHMLC
jgi:hypothetical protein